MKSYNFFYLCRSCETTQERCPQGHCVMCGSLDVWPMIELGVEPGELRCIDPRQLKFPIQKPRHVESRHARIATKPTAQKYEPSLMDELYARPR